MTPCVRSLGAEFHMGQVEHRMNIWLITTGEALPIDGVETRLWRTGSLAQALVDMGHRVTWWTSDFIHAMKRPRFGVHTTVECAPGYKIQLLASCGYTGHISLRRIKDHRQVACAFLERAAHEESPDVIVCAFPTIELADACRRFAAQRSVPLAFDIRDLWPDIFPEVAPWLLRPVVRAVLAPYDHLARRALRSADAIIGITEPILEWGLAKAGRNRRDIDAVFPLTYSAPSMSSGSGGVLPAGIDGGPSRPFTICMFATFGRHFDMQTVISAARILAEQRIPVQFAMCGSGDLLDSLRRMAADLPSVVFPGWLNGGQMSAVMAVSHMGIAPYLPRFDFVRSIPNKPIEYMSAGLPILTSLEGLLMDIVRRENIGYGYRAGGAMALVDVVKSAMNDLPGLAAMGLRAKELFDRQFRSDIVLAGYCRFIHELVNHHQKSGAAKQREMVGS